MSSDYAPIALFNTCQVRNPVKLADNLYTKASEYYLILSETQSVLWNQVCTDNNLYNLKRKLWRYMGEDGYFYVYKLIGG